MTLAAVEMNTIAVVLIAAVIGPVLMTLLTGRQRRAEKAEDYKREDLVADRLLKRQEAAEAQRQKDARLLLAAQEETIRGTNEVARLAKENVTNTDTQLKVIHTLVNSNMTASMRGQLAALRGQYVLMKRVVAADEERGQKISPTDLAAMRLVESQARELEAALADRLKAQERADEAMV
jgi:hypothetical protein